MREDKTEGQSGCPGIYSGGGEVGAFFFVKME